MITLLVSMLVTFILTTALLFSISAIRDRRDRNRRRPMGRDRRISGIPLSTATNPRRLARKAHLKLSTDGPRTKRLEINGQHIPGVTSTVISVNVTDIPTATLTIRALDGLLYDGNASVTLDSQTEETLRLLGWTKAETTQVYSEDYPPTDTHFPDIGGRR